MKKCQPITYVVSSYVHFEFVSKSPLITVWYNHESQTSGLGAESVKKVMKYLSFDEKRRNSKIVIDLFTQRLGNFNPIPGTTWNAFNFQDISGIKLC